MPINFQLIAQPQRKHLSGNKMMSINAIFDKTKKLSFLLCGINSIIVWIESLQTNQGHLNFACVQKVHKKDILYKIFHPATAMLSQDHTSQEMTILTIKWE